MSGISVTVDSSGRFLIPAEVRSSMGLRGGDQLVLVRVKDGLLLLTRAQAIERAQQIVQQHVPDEVSLADELIAERRAVAGRE